MKGIATKNAKKGLEGVDGLSFAPVLLVRLVPMISWSFGKRVYRLFSVFLPV